MELPFQLLQAEYLEGVAGRLVASNQLLGITGNLEDIVKSFNGGSSKDDVTIAPEVLNDVFGDSNDLSIDKNKLNDVFGATNKASDTGTSSGKTKQQNLGGGDEKSKPKATNNRNKSKTKIPGDKNKTIRNREYASKTNKNRKKIKRRKVK